MSVELSRARKMGPFVHTVASATWFSEMDGFFSTWSSSSSLASVVQVLVELAELLCRVVLQGIRDVKVLTLHLKSHESLLVRLT